MLKVKYDNEGIVMPKFDLYSDLHLDSWYKLYPDAEPEFLKTKGAKYALFAGDAGNGIFWYQKAINLLARAYGGYDKVITVPGNHDHYNKYHNMINLEQHDPSRQYYEKDGIRIVTATLWSNFRHSKINAEMAENNISDFDCIDNMTTGLMSTLCHESFAYLANFAGKVDIVMTHFPPIVNSVHPAYSMSSHLNPYFVNDEPDFVEQMKAKVWVHGHTHKKFDYDFKGTRFVCNPIGYAGEELRLPSFDPKVIEF